jgi:hypothetical protein
VADAHQRGAPDGRALAEERGATWRGGEKPADTLRQIAKEGLKRKNSVKSGLHDKTTANLTNAERLHIATSRQGITFAEMKKVARHGWGDLGERAVDVWLDYNNRYFGGRLNALPLHFVPTTPYGNLIGWTCCQGAVTHIALCEPREGKHLIADRRTLLHEMIHQGLHESGRNIRHKGQPWRDEIMRLHLLITGQPLWAAARIVGKDEKRKSVARLRPHPETGQLSITQQQIARWPHDDENQWPASLNLGPILATPDSPEAAPVDRSLPQSLRDAHRRFFIRVTKSANSAEPS